MKKAIKFGTVAVAVASIGVVTAGPAAADTYYVNARCASGHKVQIKVWHDGSATFTVVNDTSATYRSVTTKSGTGSYYVTTPLQRVDRMLSDSSAIYDNAWRCV